MTYYVSSGTLNLTKPKPSLRKASKEGMLILLGWMLLLLQQSGYMYFAMRGPMNMSDPNKGRVLTCMKAAANHSEAISPAFSDDDDEGCILTVQ